MSGPKKPHRPARSGRPECTNIRPPTVENRTALRRPEFVASTIRRPRARQKCPPGDRPHRTGGSIRIRHEASRATNRTRIDAVMARGRDGGEVVATRLEGLPQRDERAILRAQLRLGGCWTRFTWRRPDGIVKSGGSTSIPNKASCDAKRRPVALHKWRSGLKGSLRDSEAALSFGRPARCRLTQVSGNERPRRPLTSAARRRSASPRPHRTFPGRASRRRRRRRRRAASARRPHECSRGREKDCGTVDRLAAQARRAVVARARQGPATISFRSGRPGSQPSALAARALSIGRPVCRGNRSCRAV